MEEKKIDEMEYTCPLMSYQGQDKTSCHENCMWWWPEEYKCVINMIACQLERLADLKEMEHDKRRD